MPVLGHASWHLYRRSVEPDSASYVRIIGREKRTTGPLLISRPCSSRRGVRLLSAIGAVLRETSLAEYRYVGALNKKTIKHRE